MNDNGLRRDRSIAGSKGMASLEMAVYLGGMQALMRQGVLVTALAVSLLPRTAAAQEKASGDSVSKTPILDELRRKQLLFPIPGFSVTPLKDSFREKRGNTRIHYALDIPAPRGTPVVSADSGYVLKLYRSAAGGLMIYTSDAAERFIYYYAHLDRYRESLREGMPLARGDTIGYVGTTGNAPPNTPHLHFAILRTTDVKRWSKGMPVNPYKVFESK